VYGLEFWRADAGMGAACGRSYRLLRSRSVLSCWCRGRRLHGSLDGIGSGSSLGIFVALGDYALAVAKKRVTTVSLRAKFFTTGKQRTGDHREKQSPSFTLIYTNPDRVQPLFADCFPGVVSRFM